MGIVETGDNRLAFAIDKLRSIFSESFSVLIIPDTDDSTVSNGYHPGMRIGRVNGDHVSVEENEIGFCFAHSNFRVPFGGTAINV